MHGMLEKRAVEPELIADDFGTQRLQHHRPVPGCLDDLGLERAALDHPGGALEEGRQLADPVQKDLGCQRLDGGIVGKVSAGRKEPLENLMGERSAQHDIERFRLPREVGCAELTQQPRQRTDEQLFEPARTLRARRAVVLLAYRKEVKTEFKVDRDRQLLGRFVFYRGSPGNQAIPDGALAAGHWEDHVFGILTAFDKSGQQRQRRGRGDRNAKAIAL